MVRYDETHAFASEVLAQHGLLQDGWRIRWNRVAGTAGICHFKAKTITLSALAVKRWNWTLVEDLVVHEVAHALVGPGHAHGAVWRDQVRSLGGRPQEHCPRFSTETEHLITNLSSGQNTGFGLLCIAGAWITLPTGVAVALTAAIGLGVLYVTKRVTLEVLSPAKMKEIEDGVMNP